MSKANDWEKKTVLKQQHVIYFFNLIVTQRKMRYDVCWWLVWAN